MLRKPSYAVIIASLYLLAYIIFFYRQDYAAVLLMFMGAPIVLGWMAYTIIRFGKYHGKELDENEEWGYSDRSKDSLGIF